MAKQPNNSKHFSSGLTKVKAWGQHFLRKQSVVDRMIDHVEILPGENVLEVGCGDGFLTRSILSHTSCGKLLCFEIDPKWIGVVKASVQDERLLLKHRDILEVDLQKYASMTPFVMLANLPYQITFPILYKIKSFASFFSRGVVMIQEEVAQKLVANSGRERTFVSCYFQHYFDFELLDKVEPGAFSPPPKVFSRTIFFRPKPDLLDLDLKPGFWDLVKKCFTHPGQIVKNNLLSFFKPEFVSRVPVEFLSLRARELKIEDFLRIWTSLRDF